MKRLFLLSAFLISFCSLASADELYEVNYNIIPLPSIIYYHIINDLLKELLNYYRFFVFCNISKDFFDIIVGGQ